MAATCRVNADTSQFAAFMDELQNELSKHSAKVTPEVRNCLVNIFTNSPGKLVAFESQPASMGTITVTVEPTQLLLDLLATVRAGDFDDLVKRYDTHHSVPS